MNKENEKLQILYDKISLDQISGHKSAAFIREMNSCSPGHLDSLALTDGNRKYTYRQMFRHWDYYAEVFSALSITGKDHSRAGLTGVPSAQTIIAFYALNMTGASVSMVHSLDLKDPDRWERMVREERITDLILADSMTDVPFLRKLIRDKDKLGLRHIIILHIPPSETYADYRLRENSRDNYKRLQSCGGALFMEDLLEKYEAAPIIYADQELDQAAVICHTSGTVKGIHKPIPLSDHGLNEVPICMLSDERFSTLYGRAVCGLFMDMSAAYALVDMVHLILAFGGRIVVAPGLPYGRISIRVMEEASVNLLFGSGALMETMMALPERPDLSRLEFVFLGGSFVSAPSKKRYDAYLADCGAKTACTIGYGLSEAAGACLLSSSDREDSSLGYPLPGIKAKIYVEEEDRYYDLSDGSRTGILFLSSPSISRGRIDDRVYFELEQIDGDDYLNTFDRVHVARDGSLYYGGRMNRYFVNNQGIRFDPDLVETTVSLCPAIRSCALVPGYDKTIHDTIPVLYVSLTEDNQNKDEVSLVRQALKDSFIGKKIIKETNLPGQCVICRDIPCNEGGKPDIWKIRDGKVQGKVYAVKPVRENGDLLDLDLKPFRNAPGRRAGIPAELEEMVRLRKNGPQRGYRKRESRQRDSQQTGRDKGCRVRNGLPCHRNPHHCPYGSNCPKVKEFEEMMDSISLWEK